MKTNVALTEDGSAGTSYSPRMCLGHSKVPHTASSTLKKLAVALLFCVFMSAERASAYYDPGVQRWINRDPLGEPGFEAQRLARKGRRSVARSGCHFAGSDPVNSYDPKGLVKGGPQWAKIVPCEPEEISQCEFECYPEGTDPICWDVFVDRPGDPEPEWVGHGLNCNCDKPKAKPTCRSRWKQFWDWLMKQPVIISQL